MSTLGLYSFKKCFACRDFNVHGIECFEGGGLFHFNLLSIVSP